MPEKIRLLLFHRRARLDLLGSDLPVRLPGRVLRRGGAHGSGPAAAAAPRRDRGGADHRDGNHLPGRLQAWVGHTVDHNGIDALLSCPGRGYFVPIDSESTDTM